MENLFRHLHMSSELAIEFMAVFSRAEYALKSAGYVLEQKTGISADWDKFANKIDVDFMKVKDEMLERACEFLLLYPPRKQILHGGRIAFTDQKVDDKQRTTQQLLRFVRTIRNNLFHGGKFMPEGEFESERNENLVKASLIILRRCIEIDQDVKLSFER